MRGEKLSDCGNNLATGQEDFSGLVVDYKVNITLTVTRVHICQAMKLFRQRLKGFGDNVKFLGGDRKLSARRTADKTVNADHVAQIPDI